MAADIREMGERLRCARQDWADQQSAEALGRGKLAAFAGLLDAVSRCVHD